MQVSSLQALGAVSLVRDSGGNPTTLATWSGAFGAPGIATFLAAMGASPGDSGVRLIVGGGIGNGTGDGGDLWLTGGEGGGASGNGGWVFLIPANSPASGSGGSVLVTVGAPAGGAQGHVRFVPPFAGGTAIECRFYDDDSSNYFSIKAPSVIASDTPYIWPDAYPAADGYVLTSTTAGVLSWAPPLVP